MKINPQDELVRNHKFPHQGQTRNRPRLGYVIIPILHLPRPNTFQESPPLTPINPPQPVLATLAQADYGPHSGRGWHGPGGGGSNGWGGYPGGGGGRDDDDDDDDFFPGSGNGNNNPNGGNGQFGGIGFDINRASYIRNIHGIVASVAFIGLFPLGSILMRIVPGRLALWVHAVFQTLTLGVYIAAVGLGIYLAKMVRIPGGGDLVSSFFSFFYELSFWGLLLGMEWSCTARLIRHDARD